jgi:hypothetical protein
MFPNSFEALVRLKLHFSRFILQAVPAKHSTQTEAFMNYALPNHPSTPPCFPVQASVLNGFGQVLGTDIFTFFEVGNGSAHL